MHRHGGPAVVWLVVLAAVGLMLRERTVFVEATEQVRATGVDPVPEETVMEGWGDLPRLVLRPE